MPTSVVAGTERLYRSLRSLPWRGTDVLAVLNGLLGDVLADRASSLAIPTSLRTFAGQEVPLDREALAEMFPEATDRLCVLVHGLMSSESIWGFPAASDRTYGEMLARDQQLTSLYIRYNTGRRISANGHEVASMLSELHAAWPVPVREINFIGHSIGDLVIRSACH